MIVHPNTLVEGFSGKLGKVIMKKINGKTFATQAPVTSPVWSDKQKQNRDKFKYAAAWAKAILADPQRKAYYQAKAKKLKLVNAYTAAVTDYLRKAQITIDTKGYKGKAGDTIKVISSKNGFRVRKLKVTLHDVNNEVRECGYAAREGQEFIYKQMGDFQHHAYLKVVITADEFVMNETMKEFIIPLS